jgi:hypothetical protein
MMPNKTIYMKDADLPLFEQAQQQLGESVSSLFAEFLRDRVAKLTPEESRIIELINQLAEKRDAVSQEYVQPYAQAEAYAEKALKSVRAGEIRNAKIFFHAANTYHEWAERDAKQTKDLEEKISEMLGADQKPTKRRR